MVRLYFNETNLAKHKLKSNEVEEAIDDFNSCDYSIEPSRDGNDRIMVVGRARNGRLIEVGIELLPDDVWNVFHAMDAGIEAVRRSGYVRKR